MKQIGQASKSREEPLAADAILRPIIIISVEEQLSWPVNFFPLFPYILLKITVGAKKKMSVQVALK